MTSRIQLPHTSLSVFPLCLGGNVFGWSANQEESFAVLDAYYEVGGNFIDTADVYSEWKEGNSGGESETIIGNWMKSRGNRQDLVIATKVFSWSKRPGLSSANIKAAIGDSLRRLQTDHVDIYYSHQDDKNVELSETLGAYTDLIRDGKIQVAAASNYSGDRLREAARVSKERDLTSYIGVQNLHNLVDREVFESDVEPTVKELNISSMPYCSLARGFLTGKYKKGISVDSMRAAATVDYQNDKGWAVLESLQKISQTHHVSMSAIALAWLRGRGEVPIASARTVEQLKEITQLVQLSQSEMQELDSISA